MWQNAVSIIYGTIQGIVCHDFGKARITSVRIPGLQAEIRICIVQTMKQDCYPFNYDVQCNVTIDLPPVMLKRGQEVDPKGWEILLMVNSRSQQKDVGKHCSESL
jgi:hypothetical protein